MNGLVKKVNLRPQATYFSDSFHKHIALYFSSSSLWVIFGSVCLLESRAKPLLLCVCKKFSLLGNQNEWGGQRAAIWMNNLWESFSLEKFPAGKNYSPVTFDLSIWRFNHSHRDTQLVNIVNNKRRNWLKSFQLKYWAASRAPTTLCQLCFSVRAGYFRWSDFHGVELWTLCFGCKWRRYRMKWRIKLRNKKILK